MTKTPVVAATASVAFPIAPARSRPESSRAPVAPIVVLGGSRSRPRFALRPRRLATGYAPAALIALVWVALWAWVSLGVAAPLSRLAGPEQAPPVPEQVQRL